MSAKGESTAISEGIRVTVRAEYVPDQSSPVERRYVFAYTVRIENQGKRPAQLRTRRWTIVDGNGQVEEVHGVGVVGKQPYLKPGQAFEYTSGCVLKTSRGEMRGAYQMARDDGSSFDAVIAVFVLSLPHSLN